MAVDDGGQDAVAAQVGDLLAEDDAALRDEFGSGAHGSRPLGAGAARTV